MRVFVTGVNGQLRQEAIVSKKSDVYNKIKDSSVTKL